MHTDSREFTLSEPGFRLPTMREAVAPLFRHRTAVLITAVLGALLVVGLVASLPRQYEAEMKILVNRERADTLVTSDAQAATPTRAEITEEELYSEVELIQSRDLLEQVVDATGITHFDAPGVSHQSNMARMAAAVAVLRDNLTVEPVKKTTLIRVAYRSTDPQLAASVLTHLSTLFLAKHLAVHRPAGAYDFFAAQVRRYEGELAAANSGLASFTEREHVVSAAAEKEQTLQRLGEFQAIYERTQADIADATRRLKAIRAQAAVTPERHTTQIRNTGNVETLRTLQQQTLALQIVRDEMREKFTPQYPPLVRVEQQLAQLAAAAAAAERTPLRDETSDQNPTSQWLQTEAARVETERAALTARAAAVHRSVVEYTARAERLDSQSVDQEQLRRAAKAAEDNLTMYRRKQEEARVSDALDRTRIANVAVADAPAVPQAPSGPRTLLLLLLGFAAVFIASIGAGYAMHVLNPRFHTPDDVTTVLGVPVLATLPVAD